MKRKIALCLVVLLAVLVINPLEAHAVFGGPPPTNTISIDNGNSAESHHLDSQGQPTYYMNKMFGFSGKTITRVWVYLSHGMGETIEDLTLVIYSGGIAPAGLADPLVEQAVTIPLHTDSGWFSFELDVPFTVPTDTDTLLVGFRRDASPIHWLMFTVDNSGTGGADSYMGFGPSSDSLLATYDINRNFMIRAEYQVIFSVTVAPTEHGTITANTDSERVGNEINLAITPDEGYRLVDNSLMFNGNLITGEYFTMPAEDVVVTGEFEKIPYDVGIMSVDHGTIESDKATAGWGDTVTLTITPDAGYRLVDGSLLYNSDVLIDPEFEMPNTDVLIHATFEQIMYSVDVAPLTHGTIEADKTTAAFEDTVSLTITPDAGYRLVDGSLLYNSDVLIDPEFEMPNTDVLIHANFELIPFEISVEADVNGSFGSDKEQALPGEIVTVTVTPKTGYRLVVGSLKYNGIAIEGTTFVMPSASVTITGDFELINQIPNTGDVVNSNVASMMMLLGFALVSGSVLTKKKRKF